MLHEKCLVFLQPFFPLLAFVQVLQYGIVIFDLEGRLQAHVQALSGKLHISLTTTVSWASKTAHQGAEIGIYGACFPKISNHICWNNPLI